MGDIDKIAKLLQSSAIEKQIAAAIVLGEIKAKGTNVVDGLKKLLSSPVPPVQRHALEALARIGSKRVLPNVFPLLTSHAEEVRRAAAAAVASVGPEVVPTIRSRMSVASPEERRVLDGILAELGGDDAFTTLLAGLDSSDEEAAKAAALAVRHEVKRADAKQRRRYVSQTERFLNQKKQPSPNAMAAAIKILGYLEDPRAVPALVAYAKDKKADPAVRREAMLAIRFTAPSKGTPADVVNLLLDVAEGEDRAMAQNALHTLSNVDVPARSLKRIAQLTRHPDVERSSLAILELGRRPGLESAEALVDVLATIDRRRAELAAKAIEGRAEAAPALAKALLAAKDADRAWLLRNVLRPHTKTLKSAVVTKLRDAALAKVAEGERGYEAALDIARDGNAKAVAEGLRELATKLLRGKKHDRARTVLQLLSKSEHATPEDLYKLASLELAKSRLDTTPSSRANDDALKILGDLAGRGFDVLGALRRDRTLEPAMLYYVGFHFTETRSPLGTDLLAEVVKKGGRTKIAKMAKNKLALAPVASA